MVVRQAGDVRLRVGVDRLPALEVDGGQDLLVELEVERDLDRPEAAAALRPEGRGQVGADQDAAVGAHEADLPSMGSESRRSSSRAMVIPASA